MNQVQSVSPDYAHEAEMVPFVKKAIRQWEQGLITASELAFEIAALDLEVA